MGFSILPDGRLDAAQVTRTSRFDALDRAALQTVLVVGAYRPIPSAFGVERWEVEIPIAYRLD